MFSKEENALFLKPSLNKSLKFFVKTKNDKKFRKLRFFRLYLEHELNKNSAKSGFLQSFWERQVFLLFFRLINGRFCRDIRPDNCLSSE